MIGNLLRRLFSPPTDPLDEAEFRMALEDEARRNAGIDAAFARAYRDPLRAARQLAAMTPTQRDRCLGRDSYLPKPTAFARRLRTLK